MRLSALLEPGMTVLGDGWEAVEIDALTADSRAVGPGTLFAALPGHHVHGRAFVAEAVARGARAVLAGEPLAEAVGTVPLVVDPDPRRRLALMAARFFGAQPSFVAAVTGTNGKTSVAHFTAGIWRRVGRPAAALGTLGLDAPGRTVAGGLTTPDPVRLHELLAGLAADGVEHLALEASSHGLDQRRLDGVVVHAAAFTNLSRDHLDYHPDLDSYLQAKRRLFDELLVPGGTAVLPVDQPQYPLLRAAARERDLAVIDHGLGATRIRLLERRATPHVLALALAVDGDRFEVESGLSGDFQADNLMAALGLALASGVGVEVAVAALGELTAPPGRMQRAATTASGAAVVVDYAHTPDALARVLGALRATTSGRLFVVFGCGGDRDPGKRPLMGRVAAALADRVIVTDDNPRGEDPALIRRAVLDAVPDGEDVGDRRTAIQVAVHALSAGDTLLIAGKGHERGQIVGERVLPFDDVEEARAAVALAQGMSP
jgi:UDP-N-acetylmuramoyl-L-alanyl-D-glutamate--2,6-diaminopimelate ligase